MEYILIISFILSGISAYFILKAKIKYHIKLIVNASFLFAITVLMALTGWQDLATLLYVILVSLTVGGVVTHFLVPPFFNAAGRALSEVAREKYKDMTYDELLYDGQKIYFAVLLFTTMKLFLYVLLLCACMGIIK